MYQDPSSPHDKNPFEVLGLQGPEDLPAIRKAFLRIAAHSHPDRLRMKSQEEKAQALEVFLSAKKSFEVLSQPDKRREWSERMAATKPAPAPVPRTPFAPVTPPPEDSSAPMTPRPGPAPTPAHEVPVASPPRPGTPPAPPPRSVPSPPPSRPGPARTPAPGVPVASPPSRPGPAPTPAHGVPVTPPAPAPPPASAAPRAASGMPPTVEPKPAPRGGPLPASVALQFYKLGMLALESSDYAKALDLFARAAKVSPTPRHQAMELVCRGHQYLSTRFFDRARESFERALQLLPECREARAGLDLIDKQSGRYLKGR